MKFSGARGAVVGRSAVLAALLWAVGPASAADDGAVVGRVTSPAGSVLARSGQTWRALAPKSAVSAGQYLVTLPGGRGEIASRDGAVQLSLWGNLPVFYDAPILESAVALRDEAAFDLDFVLVRGRVVLTKLPGRKAARVRAHFFENAYELTLSDAGSEVVLELVTRWPSDVPFARPQREVPTEVLLVYAVKGTADLRIGDDQYLMSAPASFRWDNVVGREVQPRRNAPLPAWEPRQGGRGEAEAMRAAVKKQQERLADTPAQTVIAEELKADDPATRELAVYSAAGLDDLAALVSALSNPKFPDERGAAILALRQWIAAASLQGARQVAGQDSKLFQFLGKQLQFSEREAESVLQLLHGFRESDRNRPETYELLIEYLHHPKLPIRELSRWYLYRWVSAGRTIPYNAADPQTVERGYKQWKKLIPDGQLPPRAKPDEAKDRSR